MRLSRSHVPGGPISNPSLHFKIRNCYASLLIQYFPGRKKHNFKLRNISCWLTVSKYYPIYHVEVLFWAAEVVGEVRYAERFMLARVDPTLVLCGSGDPVKKDPEGLPHGLLTNWPKQTGRKVMSVVTLLMKPAVSVPHCSFQCSMTLLIRPHSTQSAHPSARAVVIFIICNYLFIAAACNNYWNVIKIA